MQAAGGECTWADGEQRCESVKILAATFLLLSVLCVTFNWIVVFLSPRFNRGTGRLRRVGVLVYILLLIVKVGLICVTLIEAKNVRIASCNRTCCMSAACVFTAWLI